MIDAMPVPLSDFAKRLIDTKTFAILCTINPDGGPQSSVIWVKRDGDDVVFSTIRGRRKTRNMQRDARVSLCLYDPADPYLYVEIRGEVSMTEAGGRELINEMSQWYDGTEFRVEPPEITRLVCRVTPAKLIDHA